MNYIINLDKNISKYLNIIKSGLIFRWFHDSMMKLCGYTSELDLAKSF